MCEPMTLSAIAIGAVVVGGGVSAYSTYESGQAEADQADANAQLARQNAAYAEASGALEAGRLRAEGGQLASEQKVAVAGSGFDTSGAAGMFAATRGQAELDAITAKHNALMEAWGFRVEEQQYIAQRRMAKRKSVLGPLAIGLGTAGQVAGMGADAKRASRAKRE